MSNAGTITTLTNSGDDQRRRRRQRLRPTAARAAPGVSNAGDDRDADQQRHDQRRKRRQLRSHWRRGRRGRVERRHDHDADQQRHDQRRRRRHRRRWHAGGAGGAGVSNAGTITTLTNSGTISGGNGEAGGSWTRGRRRGRRRDIGTPARSDAHQQRHDRRRRGGNGSPSGAAGDAIYSAGAHASIGPITNSGQIIGNVEIDNQASVTVTGGSGQDLRALDRRRRSRSATGTSPSPAAIPRSATTSRSTAAREP